MTGNDSSRIVWILGSGFSQPLGGPTLEDLFENKTLARVRGALKAWDCEELADKLAVAFAVYHADQARAWADAEEFLEMLDTAASVPEAAEVLDAADSGVEAARGLRDAVVAAFDEAYEADKLRTAPIANGRSWESAKRVEELARFARLYLATACHEFVRHDGWFLRGELCPERWRPYREWARKLNTTNEIHTVVTFNYDVVVERVAEVEPVKPSEADQSTLPGNPALLKLHGSIGWDDDEFANLRARHQQEPWQQIREGHKIAIAGPGVEKQERTNGAFKPLWRRAGQEIENADVIVFVGYRFPETDAYARERLLRAISECSTDRALTVHVVLGSDLHHRHVRRVRGLLESALWRRDPVEYEGPETLPIVNPGQPLIRTHPLFSQDFLSLLDHHPLDLHPHHS